VREKDGLWAVLFWLNILAYRKQSVTAIVTEHWREYGRNYYSRHDYENVSNSAAEGVMQRVQASFRELLGTSVDGRVVSQCDDFSYTDPIDDSVSQHQGLRILFEDGSRIIFRLSGTGTAGATIRIYLEAYEAEPAKQGEDAQQALAGLIRAALNISSIAGLTGRDAPTVIT
jgi:phosphoglucomutase